MHTVAGGGSCTTPAVNYAAQLVTLPCNGVSPTSVPIAQARSVAALAGSAFLYVDEGNQVVQEVTGGTVTTVAGGGSSCGYFNGNSCDGMPATSVSLDDPVGVAALPGGGFLVTEFAGARVLMVSPGPPGGATITTLAGTGIPGVDNGSTGAATAIQLNYPSDAEPTAEGGVLIANSGSNDIRYVAPDGTVSTVAGGGPCNDATSSCDGLEAGQVALDQPASVSPIQGGSGGFLIAEFGDSAVREVTPSGTFTTVAGIPGQTGYAGDGGPATSALLSQPEQVLSAPNGGFLIADTGNEVVRQVSPTGTISSVAGTPPPGIATFAGDGGAATAASLNGPVSVSQLSNGNVLIADENNNRVREITIPSVSTISFSPASPNGGNGWYTSSVTATVKATESAKINCILDPPAAPPAFGAIPTGCPYSGSGASISGDGVHTLYTASMNSFGDQEDPIDAIVKIDTTPPKVACNGRPSFPAGSRQTVSATVTDEISGPVTPIVSARANTSHLGVHRATLKGLNNAGFLLDIFCNYVVLPVNLKPTPAVTATFAATRSGTTVQRLIVTHVPGAAAVSVTCAGKGCPFSRASRVTGEECRGKPCQLKAGKRFTHPRSVDLTSLLVSDRLNAGDRLTVTVSSPIAVGRVWRYTIVAGKRPRQQVTCLQPGFSTPGKGCKAPVKRAS